MNWAKIAGIIIIILYTTIAVATSYNLLVSDQGEIVSIEGPMTFSGSMNTYVMNTNNVVIITLNTRGYGGNLAAKTMTVDEKKIKISYNHDDAYITLSSVPERITIDGEEYDVKTGKMPRTSNVAFATIILIALMGLLMFANIALGGDGLNYSDDSFALVSLLVFCGIIILSILYTNTGFVSNFTTDSARNIVFSIEPVIVAIYGFYNAFLVAKNNVRSEKSVWTFLVIMIIIVAAIVGISYHKTEHYVMINGYAFHVYGSQKYQYDDGVKIVYTINSTGHPIENNTVVEDEVITMSKYPGIEITPINFGYGYIYNGPAERITMKHYYWLDPFIVLGGIAIAGIIAAFSYPEKS